MTHDVIVIGGGISGLATADDLRGRGFDVQVLERQVIAGGNAISERFNGFLMEHGPTTFNASVPEAVDQISRLGILEGAHDLGPDVKRRYLRDKGRLSGISTHPLGFLTSNYLSPKARFSVLMEGLRPQRKEDAEETVYAFAARRFGREFADKVIDPMAAGLFMGDARQLSISGAFSKLPEMEQKFGSITRAILKAKRGSQPGRHLYSWRGGMATIPEVLIRRLGARVKTGVAVLKIARTGGGFEVRTDKGLFRSKAVVLAVQPHVAAGFLTTLDQEAGHAAASITAPAINVAFLGFRRDQIAHPLDGLGFLSTKDKNRIISGAQFTSTMYDARAPQGHVAIQVYAGGVRNPELATLPQDDLISRILTELDELLGIKGGPVVTRLRRWALGLPQYTLGHGHRKAILETTSARVPGLFVTGNYLQGVSVANCLGSAGHTAQRVQNMMHGVKDQDFETAASSA